MLERIRSHEQRADEIRRGITAMEEYIEDLVIAECRHAEGVVERDARPLRARLADFESQLPRYVKELSELEAETAELQKRIDAAARDEPELKESRARLLTRVERKSLECETLRAERDSLREAIGRLYLKPPTDLGVETVRRILQRQREELAKVERDLTEARKQLAPAPESAQKK